MSCSVTCRLSLLSDAGRLRFFLLAMVNDGLQQLVVEHMHIVDAGWQTICWM
jgi:hypothetical protein